MTVVVIEALTVVERLAGEHPELAADLFALAKHVFLGMGHDDTVARAGLQEGLARATASAVTTAVMRERARVKMNAAVAPAADDVMPVTQDEPTA